MTMLKINATARLKATEVWAAEGPEIFQLKIRKLPLNDHTKSHYGSLLKRFPELLQGKSIPVFKGGMPGRERYTVTNENGTDTPWNNDAGAPFTFSEDEVKSTF